jgi:hypothetical protein
MTYFYWWGSLRDRLDNPRFTSQATPLRDVHYYGWPAWYFRLKEVS